MHAACTEIFCRVGVTTEVSAKFRRLAICLGELGTKYLVADEWRTIGNVEVLPKAHGVTCEGRSLRETEMSNTFIVNMGKALNDASTATNDVLQVLLRSGSDFEHLRYEVIQILERAGHQCFGRNISETQSRNRELEAANSKLLSQAQSTQPLIETLVKSKSESANLIKSLTSKQSKTTALLDTTKESLATAHAAVVEKDLRIAEISETTTALSNHLHAVEDNYSRAVTTFSAEINTSAERLAKLETELGTVSSELRAVVAKHKATERAYSQAKFDILYLREDLEIVTLRSEELGKRLVEAEAVNEKCMQRINQAEDILKSKDDEIDRLNRENSRLKEDERSWDEFLMKKMPEWEESKRRAAAAEALLHAN